MDGQSICSLFPCSQRARSNVRGLGLTRTLVGRDIKAITLAWLIAGLLLAFAGNVFAQTCALLPPGMTAWWPMDDTSGSSVADIVGSNPGIRVNGPLPTSGMVDGSLSFNGGNSYVGAPDSDLWAFGTSDFTIELWANWSAVNFGTIGHPGTIFIGNDEGPGNSRKWFFAHGGGFLNFHINGPGIGPIFFPLVPFSPVAGQWYHLAITRRGTTYIVYVNGAVSGSATESHAIPNPSSPLTIGQAESLGFMNGRLDEVTIYNRALSQPELQTIFAAGAGGKCKALQIATRAFPAARLGSTSSTQLQATNGKPPYFWRVTAGILPAGMDLSTDGVLSGIPTEAGTFNITLSVTDSVNETAQRAFTQQILLTQPPTTVRASKAGTLVVPGRASDYFILVENIGSTTAINYSAVELIEPWLTVTSTIPPATRTLRVPRRLPPAGDFDEVIAWDIPRLEPGEATTIGYSVQLHPMFPIGEKVSGGPVCATPSDPPKETACHDAYNLCMLPFDNPIGGCFFANCLGLKEKCQNDFDKCMRAAKAGSGQSVSLSAVSEDPSAASCYTHEQPSRGAIDPNEKLVLAQRFIRPDQLLVYPIHYENIGTIEARDVFVTDVLDANLDLSTLKLETPNGGSVDLPTRTVRWQLLNTNLLPGATGSVMLSARPRPGLPSGTVIRNQARIQFEVFTPMDTNEVVNIIDDVAPHCSVTALPATTTALTLPIAWVGTDPVGEVDTYSVWMSTDGGAFTPLLEETKSTSTSVPAQVGHRYSFLCVAKDTAGNIEVKPAVAETSTLVIALPGDVNSDGKVDCADLQVVKASYGKRTGQAGFDVRADVVRDGLIDIRDLAYVSQRLPVGTRCP